MKATADLLIEIGTAELPAKGLNTLARALEQVIVTALNEAQLSFTASTVYATPRRLAVKITDLATQQPERQLERKGPAVAAAFDAEGNPTPACLGFARSCGVSVEQLQTVTTPQGSWLMYYQQQPGQACSDLLPVLLPAAVAKLPLAKPMRWGESDIRFMRPVQWLVVLLGEELVPVELLGVKASLLSYGHRFHAPQAIAISDPQAYETHLQQGWVIADSAKRQTLIAQQVQDLAAQQQGRAIIPEDLLTEVSGLVEWPVALGIHFDPKFLQVPAEALISAMQVHQKCFAVENGDGHLLPYFITISNIASSDPAVVIAGNERVMRARLSDAAFFYETDKKQVLADYLPALQQVVFQQQLGSIYAKAERLAFIASFIAEQMGVDAQLAARAGLLAKADLMTSMVGEFPELQGIMGGYYAKHAGESEAVAVAIAEHYLPRFAQDRLPETQLGVVVALADRLDTLVGLLGINQPPSGDKDPFGLRRAALGVLRLLISQRQSISLTSLLQQATQAYQLALAPHTVAEVQQFILERLRAWYAEQGIRHDTLAAVLAVSKESPFDIEQRVQAVHQFRQLPAASSLAAANKRVSNILAKITALEGQAGDINPSLFQQPEEAALHQALVAKQQGLDEASLSYTEQLMALADLRQVVDNFFDRVLVMVDDQQLQHNRLALLRVLRALFLRVADISLLQEFQGN